jgi:hypothetical protein
MFNDLFVFDTSTGTYAKCEGNEHLEPIEYCPKEKRSFIDKLAVGSTVGFNKFQPEFRESIKIAGPSARANHVGATMGCGLFVHGGYGVSGSSN